MERRELSARLGGEGTPADAFTLIAEANPAKFMSAFASAVAGEGEIFLGNPGWGEAERVQAQQIVAGRGDARFDRTRGWLMIPTGGSSGRLKFARHDAGTMAAAVRGFARHFELPVVNALGVLPLFHVSGLMAWMRCAMTGGEYRAWDWKDLASGAWPELPESKTWVTSLVPTQLDRLLREPRAAERLRRLRVIFLGGAPAWPDLLERASEARLPLSLSYGMTETAAMVTASRPGEFLAGDRSSGTALPHARVELNDEGIVRLGGPALFRGYYPDWRHERKLFDTADLGRFDERRRLHLLGRHDATIITGGEKVPPAEVEATLRPAAGTPEFAVIGVPDPEWGERVVCVYPADAAFDVVLARAAARQLSGPRRPKAFIALREWPRSEAGKLNRARLVELAVAELRTGAAHGAE